MNKCGLDLNPNGIRIPARVLPGENIYSQGDSRETDPVREKTSWRGAYRSEYLTNQMGRNSFPKKRRKCGSLCSIHGGCRDASTIYFKATIASVSTNEHCLPITTSLPVLLLPNQLKNGTHTYSNFMKVLCDTHIPSFLNAINEVSCTRKGELQLILVVLPNNKLDLHAAVNKRFTIGN